MKTYGIFIKKDEKTGTIDDVLLIREGLNLYAIVFSVFWFLFHRLWWGALLFCAAASLALLMPMALGFVFIVILLLLVGLESNNMLMYSLDQRGNYYFVDFSTGIDEEDAKLKFLDKINKENQNDNVIIKS
jgi:hypothetical protein